MRSLEFANPRRRFWAASALALVISLGSTQAFALDAADAQRGAETSLSQIESDLARGGTLPKNLFPPPTTAERVAASDMLLRIRDYDRAIVELSKLLELYRQGKVPEAAFADATFMIGEAYFQSRQYLAARRHLREVLDQSARPAFESYLGRAVSRLVDISLRTGDLESLDYVFARLDALPASDRSGSLPYARAKALFARKDFAGAKQAVNIVPAGSEYAMQSQYLLGVIMVKESTPVVPVATDAPVANAAPAPAATPPVAADARQRYATSIEQFRRVTRMPAGNAAQRQVIDLAWMAIGRLFHESDNYLDAAEAYSHVDRSSPEFATMLYELAWVYVRLGDYMRAQRALEVLSIMDPQNIEAADGSLLRADLMLRSGQFEKALALYKTVQGKFDPIREQVDHFLRSTNDPAVYYDRLTADEDIPTDDKLPRVVVDWAREEAEDQHVFGMIEDVNRSRQLIKSSRKLVTKLMAVLSGPTRVRAFPELRARMQVSLSLANRASRARGTLAEGLDDVAANATGELGGVQRQRRELMRRLGWLPVSDSDFARRDASGSKQWDNVSQTIQSLTLEADRLNAIVNGLKRVLRDADAHGVTTDVNSRERFRLEITANERDLLKYRQRIDEYRNGIELGRAQIGFGDQRYVDDQEVRRQFRETFARELSLTAQGQAGESAASYARSVQPLVLRADTIEMKLDQDLRNQEEQSRALSAELERKVSGEVALLETSAQNLDTLDQQARLLVGEVAMKNFALVRDRLKSVVLRADVGIVQEAWELREEQRVRVRNLQRERSREEQNLNDELREVLDDGAEDQQ